MSLPNLHFLKALLLGIPNGHRPLIIFATEGWENESDRPLMLQLPEGQYACLAEAQVVDYVRTKFKLSDEKPYTLLTSMYGIVEDIAPYHTPWRIVMCASRRRYSR